MSRVGLTSGTTVQMAAATYLAHLNFSELLFHCRVLTVFVPSADHVAVFAVRRWTAATVLAFAA